MYVNEFPILKYINYIDLQNQKTDHSYFFILLTISLYGPIWSIDAKVWLFTQAKRTAKV